MMTCPGYIRCTCELCKSIEYLCTPLCGQPGCHKKIREHDRLGIDARVGRA